jgi:hypothetical protein
MPQGEEDDGEREVEGSSDEGGDEHRPGGEWAAEAQGGNGRCGRHPLLIHRN